MKRYLLLALLVACGGDDTNTDADGDTDDMLPLPTPGAITVTVTSPTAGDELLADETPMILVTGKIESSTTDGTLEGWVNGRPVILDADGSFSFAIEPSLGINHIVVEGGDGLGPLVPSELDVMWAPAYLPPLAGTTGFDLEGALELRLGQKFFDGRLSGTTLDITQDPVVATDLAAVLELVLYHVNLAQLLPAEGIQFGEGAAQLDLTIADATPAKIIVDGTIVNAPVSSLDLEIDLLGVFLATDGLFVFQTTTYQIDGGISADMHASARLTLRQDEITGEIAVDAVDVTATVGPLVPAFTGPDGDELDAFITLGSSQFRTLVEGLVVQELVPAFTDMVPPLLESLLGATNSVLDNVEFTLDATLGTAVTLQLDGIVGGLDVVAGPPVGGSPGHVTVRQDLAVRTLSEPLHTTSRGAPRVDASPIRPSGASSALHLALTQDLLNSLLHSLWNSGLLDGQTTVGGLTAMVAAKLSPVVLPTPLATNCVLEGERCDLILQLGQVEVGLPDFGQRFAITATAGARVVVNGSNVSLKIQEVPTVHAWELEHGSGSLTTESVEGLVAELVWPELFGAIGENLSIELPLPDLNALGLGEIAPGLMNSMLELVTRQPATATSGYLGLGANLELAAPQP